jgi:hypothetical protein
MGREKLVIFAYLALGGAPVLLLGLWMLLSER